MEKDAAADRLAAGHRQFYKLPQIPDLSSVDSALYRISSTATRSSVSEDESTHPGFSNDEDFFSYINKSVIGYNKIFCGVFGDRRVVYCDYIASGRSLSFIEDFIYNEVLPDYGNTHTTTSVTSLQTTMYRHEAKDIIRNAVRATDNDAVFFVGSGCTGAVHKLIHNLYLEKPPIVIVGPFEHHSNMLPWRHLAAKTVRLSTDSNGTVSVQHLEEVLLEERKTAKELECHLIVCLAVASNVTGILVDVDRFSALVHQYGGLIFWDYATAAPYVKIDMNPVVSGPDRDLVYKDAIYFSMHKFIGGVQTPGVLIAKNVLFSAGEQHPDGCGGGSVCFVRRMHQVYLKDVEEREEGGTPAIVESIRAGLVMQLKEAITSEVIVAREEIIVKRAWERLISSPNLLVLGGDQAPRLPVFSIVVRHVFPDVSSLANALQAPKPSERTMFLHHTFVAALLNDLFGVQCRAGCACAGPYAMDLLGINECLSKLYENVLVSTGMSSCHLSRHFDNTAREVLRPGFTRFSIPYFMSDDETNFVLDAVCFVADFGWVFLPLYSYDASTGEWKCRRHDHSEDRQWLGHIKYTQEGMVWRRRKTKPRGPLPKHFQDCLQAARVELKRAVDFVKNPKVSPVPDDTAAFDEESQRLRWFLLPCEAAAQIRGEINQLAIPTGPSSPWKPGTMDPCTNSSTLPQYSDHSCDINTTILSLRAPITSPGITTMTPLIYNEPPQSSTRGVQSNISTPPRSRTRSLHSSSPQRLSSTGKGGPPRLSSPSRPQTTQTTHLPKQRNNNHLQESGDDGDDCSFVKVICRRRRRSPSFSDVTTNAVADVDPVELENILSRMKTFYAPSAIDHGCIAETLRANKRDQISLWKRPIQQLYKPFMKAIKYFNMVHPGDRILVCLSGGKDSLSLLHCLHAYQEACRRKADFPSFEVGAITVDPGSSAFDPRPLIPYLADLGVEYLYEEQNIIGKAADLGAQCSSICSFCSRMKRGRIYAAALKHGYNVIAMGHHLDDLAESFIMSCFHNGALNTMKANYMIRDKNLRVIRPFALVREKVTRAFAKMARLPVIPENCPACFQTPKERMRIKRLLSEYENVFPNVYSSLQAAMWPLISRGVALGLSGYEDAKIALVKNAVDSDEDSNSITESF